MQPLIVTLTFDERSQQRFDALRSAHFPPERHHLAEQARRPPLSLRVTGLRSLGRGVAYVLDSPQLTALRRQLADTWWPWLTPQDVQQHPPHVTVQNKVPPERARALLQRLQSDFEPYDATGCGLALWRYLGGAWEPLVTERFSGG